jgi:hypothetical protein
MPLPASGAISFDNLQTEFGNTNPIPISDYYRGALVPNISVNSSVPTSGTISMSNFYNAAQVDRIPAAFNIGNIALSGNDFVEANTNTITITGINTPITLTFLTTTSSAQRSGTGFGTTTITTTIYVNGSPANTSIVESVVNFNAVSGATRDKKITVSNNDTVVVGYSINVTGENGDCGGTVEAATFTVSNDSSGNTVLDTFTLQGTVNVS